MGIMGSVKRALGMGKKKAKKRKKKLPPRKKDGEFRKRR